MRKYLILFIASLILVLIQTSFFLEIFGPKINPNIVYALGFAFLFANKKKYAYRTALISGIMLDLLSFNTVGFSSLFMLISFHISKYIQGKILKGIWVLIISSVIFFGLYKVIFGAGNIYDAGSLLALFEAKILISSTISSAVSLIMYGFINNYFKDIED